jgi:integrase
MVKYGKTRYPGVTYIMVGRMGGVGEERMYYIRYRRGGRDSRQIHEPVGRESAGWTPKAASEARADRARGKAMSNAEKRLAERRAKRENLAKPTIQKLWEEYRSSNPDKNWGAEKACYKYLGEKFARKTPSEIFTRDIVALRNHVFSLGRAPQTVKHVLGLLRRIINFAVRNGRCPMPDKSDLYFDMPRVDNQRTERLTEAQYRKVLKALDAEENQNDAALIRVAMTTGMRRGALLALKWEDVDFERNFITLRGESAKKGRTEKIPLSETTRMILESITRSESPYVFPGRKGRRRTEFRRMARRVKEKAGLPDGFRPLHGYRHNFASMLASSGQVDLYTIQKLLTHSSPQMTQRYAHLADEALKRAAEVSSRAFAALAEFDEAETRNGD